MLNRSLDRTIVFWIERLIPGRRSESGRQSRTHTKKWLGFRADAWKPRAGIGTLALAALIAAGALPAANAQNAPNYDALKRTLEQKFAPPATRSLAPAAETPEKKDYQWIKSKDPNGATKPADPAAVPKTDPGKPNSPSQLLNNKPVQGSADGGSWWKSLYAYAKSLIASGKALDDNVAGDGTVAAGTTVKITIDPKQKVAGNDASSAKSPGAAPAQGDVPVAKKNSFVIQLKPDATEADIAALLAKYRLSVTKIIGELGVITVEISEEPAETTRGLAASPAGEDEATADPQAKLSKILEPQIIKDLRQEPIVDAAIVNSTIGTKALRKPSGASLETGGKSYAWRWTSGEAEDGNWGLKAMRMPPVWTVLDRYRKANTGVLRPKIGVIDAGFSENPNVPFQSMIGVQKLTVLRPDCTTHHAMHVSGIIGAEQGDTPGVDGIIPGARIDAVAISNQATSEAGNLGVDQLWELQTLLFDEVLGKTMDYLVDNVLQPDNLRVINISLGYNFLAKKLIGNASPDSVEGLKLHIHHQASIIRRMAQRVENKVLFVVAAGNDSDDRPEPLPARWASPFAWAGTYEGVTDRPASNILVVEAIDRARARASFSNTGGHVSAPGIGIMSTLSGGAQPFAVCSGTSQAAPHAAALAAIMFELDPTKTPADIIAILKQTATPAPDGSKAAPSIDALDAVLQLPGTKALLADLDGDGAVGPGDLARFTNSVKAIRAAATEEATFTEDLNGDGSVDANECYWPLIDFNGSGAGATQAADFRKLGGLFRSDLSIMALAWSDAPATFDSALAGSGLAASTPADALSVAVDTAIPATCLRRDPIAAPSTVIAAAETPADTGGTAASGASGGTDVPAPAPTPAPTGGSDGTTAAVTPPASPATPAEPSTGSGAETGAATPAPAGEAASPPGTGAAPGSVAEAPATEATRGLAEETPAAAAPLQGAESIKSRVLAAIANLKKLNPRLRITINPATGLPSSISGLLPRPEASAVLGASAEAAPAAGQSEEETRRAVEGFFASGGLTAAFPTQNRLANTAYVGRRRDPDFPDRFIATVEQRVGSVPVFGSAAKLTVEGLAGVTKYVGTPSQVAITDMTAAVPADEAIAAARAKIAELNSADAAGLEHGPEALSPETAEAEAKTQLIVYDPALIEKKAGTTRLAYLVEIDRFRIFVDAKTKEVFHYYLDRPSGALRRVFDLEQTKTFPGKQVLDEESFQRAEDMPPDGEFAFNFSGAVRDYFFLVFGRYGFDDNDGPGPNGGSTLESYIRYSNARDAFWCPAKSKECPKANVMVFGPGYAGSLDIVGHEMTHGVIAHEKNLLYLNEPGAVNESLADIFGSLIEQYARVPQGNWAIGESAPGFSLDQPLRSLANPNLKSAGGKSLFDRNQRYSMDNRGQPDNYKEALSVNDTLCGSTRYQDNGCVHFNSGILNKFAYLIAEGGEHRSVAVAGIGRVKLARIAYRTMTAQLNESSGLIEAADGFALSCLELAEKAVGGISNYDCEQVFAAQQAVGLFYEGS